MTIPTSFLMTNLCVYVSVFLCFDLGQLALLTTIRVDRAGLAAHV